MRVRAFAPGRVNLIGDHTDYTGGLVMPMAIDRGTTVIVERGGPFVDLVSSTEADPAHMPLDIDVPGALPPGWWRYVAGVVAEVRPPEGGRGTVTTTLPVGAGLASSAALEVAVALALGFDGTDLALAQACQRAEHRAWGVRTGIMDQLACVAGRSGHALLIDCASLELTPVALPTDVAVLVVDTGERRSVVASAYAERQRSCELAADRIGPLRSAALADLATLDDPLRRRARHVVTENARVLAFADCLRAGDVAGAGRLMTESHRSLRDDLEVSTPALDRAVQALLATPGVHGARLTGAGLGGCVVALVDPRVDARGWRLEPSDGARSEPLRHLRTF